VKAFGEAALFLERSGLGGNLAIEKMAAYVE
jgi:hypothetical protein